VRGAGDGGSCVCFLVKKSGRGTPILCAAGVRVVYLNKASPILPSTNSGPLSCQEFFNFLKMNTKC